MNISGYTTAEIAAAIAQSEGGEPLSRQRIAAIAKAEGWKALRLGNLAFYPGGEVEAYLAARRRTRLLDLAGWNPGGRLWRDDEPDGECPVCGAYAVSRPSFQAGDSAEYLSESWPWLCEQGHTNR